MAATDRRRRQRDTLRARILDAAGQLFATEGYEAVTLRRIANAIDYSPTTVYLHFADKQALLQALCDETFDRLVHRLERLRARTGGPLAFLREGLLAYARFGLAHPHHYTATFILGTNPDAAHPYEGSAGARAFGLLRQAVQDARDAGAIAVDDTDTAAQTLWAAAHGVTSLLIRHPGFPFVGRTRLVTHTIDAVLRGMRP